MFATNAHVGRFVQRYIIQPISLLRCGVSVDDVGEAWSNDLKSLNITIEDNEQGQFIDHGVYSRNRNFRLFLSSKLGKNAQLVIADTSGRIPLNTKIYKGKLIHRTSTIPDRIIDADNLDKEKFFLDTLVSPWPLPPDTRLLTVDNRSASDEQNKNQDAIPPSPNKSFHKSGKILDIQASPYPMIDRFLLGWIQSRVERPDLQSLKQIRIFEDCRHFYYMVI
jgi:hypothetical protein